jgi:hypothetical protein
MTGLLPVAAEVQAAASSRMAATIRANQMYCNILCPAQRQALLTQQRLVCQSFKQQTWQTWLQLHYKGQERGCDRADDDTTELVRNELDLLDNSPDVLQQFCDLFGNGSDCKADLMAWQVYLLRAGAICRGLSKRMLYMDQGC